MSSFAGFVRKGAVFFAGILLTALMAMAGSEYQLYPKNKAGELDPKLFANPTSEYRGTPFWSWNCKLDKDQLLRQIDLLREMGFGGAHIHVRVGLDTEYLGDEFMSCVKSCVDKAQKESMLAWLYDEDRWPSGSAGGLVTKDESLRQRKLVLTMKENPKCGRLVGKYEVVLGKDGALASYRLLKKGEEAVKISQVWYAYVGKNDPSPWFNNQTYVDTMNPKAVRQFIKVTHDRYASVIGDRMGTVVPAIFTDEPEYGEVELSGKSDDREEKSLPFTDDFASTYRKAYGEKLEEKIPELFWELPDGKISVTRYRYYDHASERFAATFSDLIGKWCDGHDIALTGHLMAEQSLGSQTRKVGDALRGLSGFQLPGIDMLCDNMELTTAKQAETIAHQYGRPGVLSELYGVTAWDYDFVGHKGQGDWQAAMGITVRVPHLAWVSMAGEAKRDYPAAIGWQSPWYREYPLVEDHYSRVNVAMTRGTPRVRIGVIHPIESYWLFMGPEDKTGIERRRQDVAFEHVTGWMLRGMLDFDYISEALLPRQCRKVDGKQLKVGAMAYDAMLVPWLTTIRGTTLDRLEKFAAAGGKVVFAGEVPKLVDAVPSDRAVKFSAKCTNVAWDKDRIIDGFAAEREIEVVEAGKRGDRFLYQIRNDGDKRNVFICNFDRMNQHESEVRFKGDWSVTLLDTFSGKMEQLASRRDGDCTVLDWTFPAHGHLLVRLEPGWRTGGMKPASKTWGGDVKLAGPVGFTLAQPNVLLLDQAEWRLNSEPWNAAEEILRIDRAVRKKLNIPTRGGGMAQPWTVKEKVTELGRLEVKYTIKTDVNVESPKLAVEEPENMRITLDGKPVDNKVTGWWVDEAIKTIQLPSLSAGTHELVMSIGMTKKNNVEWSYLLGDFGVEINGREAKLVAAPKQLAIGDWSKQGLAFYSGNVTYHFTFEGQDQEMAVEVANFKGPLTAVSLDGKPAGRIAFAPWRLELGRVDKGPHKLDITVFGNRINEFGPVHNTKTPKGYWAGSGSWYTSGDKWSYDYQLKPLGLIAEPVLKTLAK